MEGRFITILRRVSLLVYYDCKPAQHGCRDKAPITFLLVIGDVLDAALSRECVGLRSITTNHGSWPNDLLFVEGGKLNRAEN